MEFETLSGPIWTLNRWIKQYQEKGSKDGVFLKEDDIKVFRMNWVENHSKNK